MNQTPAIYSRRDLLKRTIESGLVLGLLGTSFYGVRALSSPYPNSDLLVNAEWLAAHVEENFSVRVIDARGPLKFRYEHILNSVNLWDTEINTWDQGFPRLVAPPEKLQPILEKLGLHSNQTIVLYDDEAQRWAGRLFWILEYYGFRDVRILNGGLDAWKQGGGKTSNALTELTYVAPPLQLRPDSTKIATGQWLLDHLLDSRVQIIDTRTPQEINSSVNIARIGIIPGALNIPIESVLTHQNGLVTHSFRSSNDLQRLFKKLEPTHTIVTYSETGVRASLAYFALRLLHYPDVRVYDASWSEWGSDKRFPVTPLAQTDPTKRHTSTCW